MGLHAGYQIAKQIAENLRTVTDVVKVEATELQVTRLEQLQDEIKPHKYMVVVSPEDSRRVAQTRKRHQQSESPLIVVTVIASTQAERPDERDSNTEAFMNKVDEIHHALIDVEITLASPFGPVQFPSEAVEVPADDILSQFSLRIRQLQYQFQVNRSGA